MLFWRTLHWEESVRQITHSGCLFCQQVSALKMELASERPAVSFGAQVRFTSINELVLLSGGICRTSILWGITFTMTNLGETDKPRKNYSGS